jgi:lysozyme
VDRLKLKAQLVRHEGLRLRPYRCTAGKLTIGVGRNLEDRGISEDEARVLLENDVAQVESELAKALPWFVRLDEVRQRVLINMGFNLGVPGLLAFKQTLAAVERGDYTAASDRMLDSKWARQVGARATELAAMMKEGKDR